jgi:hypothetical protein
MRCAVIWCGCGALPHHTRRVGTTYMVCIPHIIHLGTQLLACDAPSYGVGAMLFHTTPEGLEQPIWFASRTLSTSERNYSQTEKEALALVYGVKTFERFLIGRTFQLFTDHQPLTFIFNPTRALSATATARIQRWPQNSNLTRMANDINNSDVGTFRHQNLLDTVKLLRTRSTFAYSVNGPCASER